MKMYTKKRDIGGVIIKKHRKIPIYITKLSKLIKRMPQTHNKLLELQQKLKNHITGYKGEKSLEFFYRYLPKDVYFLHNIRILQNDYYFQMDTVILSPSFITILEIKNLVGHLYFDDRFSQLIRTYEGKKEAFSNPIEQVERQKLHLYKILNQYKFTSLPIETLVVITNPSSIIEASPTYLEASEKVIRSSSLQHKYANLSRKHPNILYTHKDIKKLSKILSKVSSSYDPDVCKLYKINKNELIRGVFCSNCDHSSMSYVWGNWYCPTCSSSSKTAHITALQDYALLISHTITTSECSDYLNLSSKKQAYNLLRLLDLPFTGNRKSRKYILTPLLEKTT